MYMDEGDGEPGTGLGSVRSVMGPEIGFVLGGHGGQHTDTSSSILHGDVDAQASQAHFATLLTANARWWKPELRSTSESTIRLK